MTHTPFLLTCAFICVGFGVSSAYQGSAAEDPKSIVVKTPGLVAFWDFKEDAGQPRVSTGTKEKHPLQEVGGSIARVEGGPFSGYSAELDGTQYFKIPYAETGDLNIGGPDAQVSMFAVVCIVNLKQSRTIAGMWSEGKGANDDTGTRQYALLMNMPTYGGPRQLTPHISSEGGVTRRADGSAFPWCADYAATRSEVPEEKWCSLGFPYDGQYIRAYINGVLDARELDPAKDKRTDRYFTSEGPDGKDRGMNPYYHGRGIFRYDPAKHSQTKPMGGSDFTVGARYAVGKMLGESTIGRFGGLAVFNRAITDAEMKKLHEAANVAALPEPPQTKSQTNQSPAPSPLRRQPVEPYVNKVPFAHFITRQGNKLYDGGQEFRFVGANMPGNPDNLLQTEAKGCRGAKPPADHREGRVFLAGGQKNGGQKNMKQRLNRTMRVITGAKIGFHFPVFPSPVFLSTSFPCP